MKKIVFYRFCYLLLMLLLHNCSSQKRLLSPFQSEVDGLSVYNASYVDKQKKIVRSMQPYTVRHYREIKEIGITDVLIFKDHKDGAHENEYQSLNHLGFNNSNIHNIPFKWKDIHDYEEACKQSIEALQLLDSIARSAKKKILIHCTVGEDRTGYLSGLYLFLQNPKQDIENLFQKEMCEKGYEAGNPDKPKKEVVIPIRESLTPLFLKMTYQIKQGRLSANKLNQNLCNHDPHQDSGYKAYELNLLPKLICKSSSKYVPNIRK